MSFFRWLTGDDRRLRSAASQTSLPAMVETLETRRLLSATTGTWTHLTNTPPGNIGTMMLLTDGTVITQGNSNEWYRLTPDSRGDYINGTWSQLASSSITRLYYGSNVLPSGKVVVIGGEYTGDNFMQNFTNTGEIYDPLTNTWSPIADFPRSNFGDDPTALLSNGKILAGYISGPETFLYNPATDTWTQTGTKLRNDASDEETWLLLPDGSVLSYDVFSSASSGVGHAQRYIPSTGKWVDAGTVPVLLSSSSVGFEFGPGTLLPNGKVFVVGGNEKTALYNPATNSWTAGPSLPAGMGADDAPGAMLPNGHFIFAADTTLFVSPTRLFDYDYITNKLTDITPTTPATLASELSFSPAFVNRMLVLPDGHLLFSAGGDVWDFAPNGTPNTTWRPTISSITPLGSGYQLSGKQLTGISEGASYGDDAEMSTNYPIVRFTDASGNVKYARTSNWTPSVATGNTIQTVQFTLPANLNPGTYKVAVIANGIASAEKQFVVQARLILTVPNTLNYQAEQTARPIDPAIVVDSSFTTLSSATVTIKNYKGTQDVLTLILNSNTMGNITWKYANGVMTLTSILSLATPAQFQAALRAVTYYNGSPTPDTTPRQVEYKVFSGSTASNALVSTVNVTAPPSPGFASLAASPANGTTATSLNMTPLVVPVTTDAKRSKSAIPMSL